MEGNSYNSYKIVHSSLYKDKDMGRVIYKSEIADLIKKLSRKRCESVETESNTSKTATNNTNTYNKYLLITKTNRLKNPGSNSHSLSISHAHLIIKMEQNSKMKELCSLINTCVN